MSNFFPYAINLLFILAMVCAWGWFLLDVFSVLPKKEQKHVVDGGVPDSTAPATDFGYVVYRVNMRTGRYRIKG